jgi:periplasmic protein CpxP/Spy
MKKLFIAALLFVGVASFAQDADSKPTREPRERLTPEQRNDKQLKKLTSDLNLDANQQAQVKQLLADRSAKAEQFREARQAKKDNDVKPTAAEREAFKKQMMDEKDANDAKMKAILNADQYKKWTSIQEENRDKAREKMKEYRKENN